MHANNIILLSHQNNPRWPNWLIQFSKLFPNGFSVNPGPGHGCQLTNTFLRPDGQFEATRVKRELLDIYGGRSSRARLAVRPRVTSFFFFQGCFLLTLVIGHFTRTPQRIDCFSVAFLKPVDFGMTWVYGQKKKEIIFWLHKEAIQKPWRRGQRPFPKLQFTRS